MKLCKQKPQKAECVPHPHFLRWLFVWITTVSVSGQLLAETEPILPVVEANTFSIVARDPDTGELGVAVQSKIVGVGNIVPWAKADIGAVATQAFANTEYGPIGLELLQRGVSPERAIDLMLRLDPYREVRQVGILNAKGETAAFTGEKCQDAATHITGENFSVQGNLLTGKDVVQAIADAFEAAEGTLGERMIAALKAGQAAGGDKRGKQSAALLIVKAGWGYGGQNDRFRDIRVDDHETPIEELDRVYQLHQQMFPRPDAEREAGF